MKKISQILTFIILFSLLTGFIVYAQQNNNDEQENPEKSEQSQERLSEEELKQKFHNLVGQLGDDDFQTRESATQELIKLGEDILGFVEETLEKTTDPEVKMRLTFVKEQLTQKEETKPKTPEGRVFPPLRLEVKPGSVSTITVINPSGTYSLERMRDGKVKITINPKDGEKTTKEFDSMDKFKEEMPEIAKLFEGFGSLELKIEPRLLPRDDNQEEEDSPLKDFEKLRKELEERFKREFPDLEELFKKLEEMQKDFPREFTPAPRGQEGNKQFYRASRTDDDGNVYEIIVQDGKVTAILSVKNEPQVTKKFDSVETFKKEWPEFYNIFPNLEKELRLPEKDEEDNTKSQNQVEDAIFGEISPVLRAQLQIKEGEGLIVRDLTGRLDDKEAMFRRAGVEKFDIILEINNKPVTSVEMIAEEINNAEQDSVIQFTIFRRGNKLTLEVNK